MTDDCLKLFMASSNNFNVWEIFVAKIIFWLKKLVEYVWEAEQRVGNVHRSPWASTGSWLYSSDTYVCVLSWYGNDCYMMIPLGNIMHAILLTSWWLWYTLDNWNLSSLPVAYFRMQGYMQISNSSSHKNSTMNLIKSFFRNNWIALDMNV